MIGCLTVSLHIPHAQSLKEKRQALRSLIETLRHKYNVSVAEMDLQELHQRSILGVACIANEQAHIRQALDTVSKVIESRPDLVVCDATIEML